VPPAPGCYVVWHFVQTVRDQLLAADRLHPHRAEAGITLPTHAEHLLSQVRRRRGQNADDQRAGRPDGRRHVLRLSSSPSSSTACTTSIGSSTAPWVYGTLTAALGLVYADAVLVLVTCSGGSRQSAELGNRWDHLGGGRPVPASRAPHPTDGRPTLQPPQYNAAKTIEAFSAR
jgi:hypothetical protein